jgi:hypothetical protein
MTLMPEIHDALARAVAVRRARRRRSWRAGLVVLGGVVFAGTAVAATGGWHPILGDDDRGHPRESQAAVPADQLALLEVLRREQTGADRGADVRAVLRLLGREEIDGVHTDGVRLLRRHPGGVTVLVPTERVGRHDKGYPSTVRREVLCVMTSNRSRAHTIRITGTDGKTSKRRLPARLGVGVSCGTVRDLRTTGIGASTALGSGEVSVPASSGKVTFIAAKLVPDGVASVVVRLRGGRKVAATVRDNIYEFQTRELPPGWGVRWLDAHGRRIEHRRADVPG